MMRATYGSSHRASTVDGESPETNISVVVRVRPRNSIEREENSPVIVRTGAVRSREIQVRVGPTDSASKTYTFDKVFGPDADQTLIFNDVVAPMLEEVLMGYNCTIFAYGQTGTGKTYTMEGDLSAGLTPDSGVIPRTLYALFETLGNAKYESAVRMSCTELYCEELHDLLAPEHDNRRLKLYEDYNRKGSVLIQGLEEVLVKNIEDVLSVLKGASGNRQIAATRMNEQSSRSHCIYTITVRIKEAIEGGEELVKLGKLNLVDLAGSENIGRSGAFSRQAKEAGIINTSLLTLGRVINALVERSPHVPYRESKLTRILQDSLGGKTKTCIIAAVSPSRSNLEETVSTLDYAHRAKNIRNRPEVNQKMTKRAMIREYEEQIERLKADLLATREKNGIYMDEQHYNSVVAEATANKRKVEESSRLIAAKDEEMLAVAMRAQQAEVILHQTKAALNSTQLELAQRNSDLQASKTETAELQRQLQEQQCVQQAFENTERLLHETASKLVATLDDAVSDLDTLYVSHGKRSEKERNDIDNIKSFHTAVTNELARVSTGLINVRDSVLEFNGSLYVDFEQFLKGHMKFMDESHLGLQAMLSKFNEKIADLETEGSSKNESLQSELKALQEMTTQLVANFQTESQVQSEKLSSLVSNVSNSIINADQTVKSMSNEAIAHVTSVKEIAINAFTATSNMFKSSYQRSLAALEEERVNLRIKAKDLDEKLANFRDSQRDANVNLQERIAKLLFNYSTDMTEKTDLFAEAACGGLLGASRRISDIAKEQDEDHQKTLSIQMESGSAMGNNLDSIADNIGKAVSACEPAFLDAKRITTTLSEHVQTSANSYGRMVSSYHDSALRAINDSNSALRRQSDILGDMSNKCKDSSTAVLSEFGHRIEHILEQNNSKLLDLKHQIDSHKTDAESNIENEVGRLEAIARETSVNRLTPFVGDSTPIKKVFEYPREFPRTVITYSDE